MTTHEQRKRRNAGCRATVKRPLLERNCTVRPDGVCAATAFPPQIRHRRRGWLEMPGIVWGLLAAGFACFRRSRTPTQQ
jgi:hypothetical protein